MIFAAGVLHHVNMLEVVRHPWFISAVSGFIGAQVLKLIIAWWRHRTWNFRELVSAGGMPSSHSAFVAALACAVGFTDGFDEPYAMIAVGFARMAHRRQRVAFVVVQRQPGMLQQRLVLGGKGEEIAACAKQERLLAIARKQAGLIK